MNVRSHHVSIFLFLNKRIPCVVALTEMAAVNCDCYKWHERGGGWEKPGDDQCACNCPRYWTSGRSRGPLEQTNVGKSFTTTTTITAQLLTLSHHQLDAVRLGDVRDAGVVGGVAGRRGDSSELRATDRILGPTYLSNILEMKSLLLEVVATFSLSREIPVLSLAVKTLPFLVQ